MKLGCALAGLDEYEEREGRGVGEELTEGGEFAGLGADVDEGLFDVGVCSVSASRCEMSMGAVHRED